jgi:hypothetical protein
VGGKPGQHRRDRLGLLLVKAAASLAAQHLHLDGEPWWPRSWPSRATAAVTGGGLAGGWGGLRRVGVVHARLLADHGRPRLEAVEGVWHPDPDPVSITLIRAFARPRPGRRACSTDDDPTAKAA